MHIFEIMNPLRGDEVLEKEYSEDIQKIIDERNEAKESGETGEIKEIEGEIVKNDATDELPDITPAKIEQQDDDDDLPDFAPAKIEDESRDLIKTQTDAKVEVDEDDLKFDPLTKEDLLTSDQILSAQEKLMSWYNKLLDFKNKLLTGAVVTKEPK
jgi:hypothetical protein